MPHVFYIPWNAETGKPLEWNFNWRKPRIRRASLNTTQLFISKHYLTLSSGVAIWCYQCTPATPGCQGPFNWRGVGYLGNPCPDNEDICVKLIERKGG